MKRANEPIETTDPVVRCDGGDSFLGHPAIFLNLGKAGEVTCPYCSNFFVKSSYSTTGKKAKILRRVDLQQKRR